MMDIDSKSVEEGKQKAESAKKSINNAGNLMLSVYKKLDSSISGVYSIVQELQSSYVGADKIIKMCNNFITDTEKTVSSLSNLSKELSQEDRKQDIPLPLTDSTIVINSNDSIISDEEIRLIEEWIKENSDDSLTKDEDDEAIDYLKRIVESCDSIKDNDKNIIIEQLDLGNINAAICYVLIIQAEQDLAELERQKQSVENDKKNYQNQYGTNDFRILSTTPIIETDKWKSLTAQINEFEEKISSQRKIINQYKISFEIWKYDMYEKQCSEITNEDISSMYQAISSRAVKSTADYVGLSMMPGTGYYNSYSFGTAKNDSDILIKYDNAKKYFNETQKKILCYLYKTEGEYAANRYLDAYSDYFNKQIGLEKATDAFNAIVKGDENGLGLITADLRGIMLGTEQWFDVVGQIFSTDGNMTDSEYAILYVNSMLGGLSYFAPLDIEELGKLPDNKNGYPTITKKLANKIRPTYLDLYYDLGQIEEDDYKYFSNLGEDQDINKFVERGVNQGFIGKSHLDWLNTFFNSGVSTGNMIPSVAMATLAATLTGGLGAGAATVNAVGKNVGLISMGLFAFSADKNASLREGRTMIQSCIHASLDTLKEVGTEIVFDKLFGFIPGLPNFGEMPRKTVLETIGAMAVRLFFLAPLGEITEEEAGYLVFDPIIDLITDGSTDYKVNLKEALEIALTTAISTFQLQLGSTIISAPSQIKNSGIVSTTKLFDGTEVELTYQDIIECTDEKTKQIDNQKLMAIFNKKIGDQVKIIGLANGQKVSLTYQEILSCMDFETGLLDKAGIIEIIKQRLAEIENLNTNPAIIMEERIYDQVILKSGMSIELTDSYLENLGNALKLSIKQNEDGTYILSNSTTTITLSADDIKTFIKGLHEFTSQEEMQKYAQMIFEEPILLNISNCKMVVDENFSELLYHYGEVVLSPNFSNFYTAYGSEYLLNILNDSKISSAFSEEQIARLLELGIDVFNEELISNFSLMELESIGENIEKDTTLKYLVRVKKITFIKEYLLFLEATGNQGIEYNFTVTDLSKETLLDTDMPEQYKEIIQKASASKNEIVERNVDDLNVKYSINEISQFIDGYHLDFKRFYEYLITNGRLASNVTIEEFFIKMVENGFANLKLDNNMENMLLRKINEILLSHGVEIIKGDDGSYYQNSEFSPIVSISSQLMNQHLCTFFLMDSNRAEQYIDVIYNGNLLSDANAADQIVYQHLRNILSLDKDGAERYIKDLGHISSLMSSGSIDIRVFLDAKYDELYTVFGDVIYSNFFGDILAKYGSATILEQVTDGKLSDSSLKVKLSEIIKEGIDIFDNELLSKFDKTSIEIMINHILDNKFGDNLRLKEIITKHNYDLALSLCDFLAFANEYFITGNYTLNYHYIELTDSDLEKSNIFEIESFSDDIRRYYATYQAFDPTVVLSFHNEDPKYIVILLSESIKKYNENFSEHSDIFDDIFYNKHSVILEIYNLICNPTIENFAKIKQLSLEYDLVALHMELVKDMTDTIRRDYANKLRLSNKLLENIPTRVVDGLTVYEVTDQEMYILSHGIVAEDIHKHPKLFLSKRGEYSVATGLSTALISTENCNTFGGNSLVLGFDNIDGHRIVHVTKSDGANGSVVGEDDRIFGLSCTFDELLEHVSSVDKETLGNMVSNEVFLDRYDSDGNPLQPSYIICIDDITTTAKNAAIELGQNGEPLPIILFHKGSATVTLNNGMSIKLTDNYLENLGNALKLSIKQNADGMYVLSNSTKTTTLSADDMKMFILNLHEFTSQEEMQKYAQMIFEEPALLSNFIDKETGEISKESIADTTQEELEQLFESLGEIDEVQIDEKTSQQMIESFNNEHGNLVSDIHVLGDVCQIKALNGSNIDIISVPISELHSPETINKLRMLNNPFYIELRDRYAFSDGIASVTVENGVYEITTIHGDKIVVDSITGETYSDLRIRLERMTDYYYALFKNQMEEKIQSVDYSVETDKYIVKTINDEIIELNYSQMVSGEASTMLLSSFREEIIQFKQQYMNNAPGRISSVVYTGSDYLVTNTYGDVVRVYSLSNQSSINIIGYITNGAYLEFREMFKDRIQLYNVDSSGNYVIQATGLNESNYCFNYSMLGTQQLVDDVNMFLSDEYRTFYNDIIINQKSARNIQVIDGKYHIERLNGEVLIVEQGQLNTDSVLNLLHADKLFIPYESLISNISLDNNGFYVIQLKSGDEIVLTVDELQTTAFENGLMALDSISYLKTESESGSVISKISIKGNDCTILTIYGDEINTSLELIESNNFLEELLLYKYRHEALVMEDGNYCITNRFGDKFIISPADFESGIFLNEIISKTDEHATLLVNNWLIENVQSLGTNLTEEQQAIVNEQLQSIADRIGATVEEVREAINKALKNITEESSFGTRVSLDVLQSILNSHIKNLYETGTSGGEDNFIVRRLLEASHFLVPDKVDAQDAAIYGLLFPNLDTSDDYSAAANYYKNGPGSWYGAGNSGFCEVVIIFNKAKIIKLTSMTIGDSLDYARQGIVQGTSASSPQFTGAYPRFLNRVSTLSEIENADLTTFAPQSRGSEYIELQIYGQYAHTTDVIEEVVFMVQPDSEIISQLESMGIKWRVITE